MVNIGAIYSIRSEDWRFFLISLISLMNVEPIGTSLTSYLPKKRKKKGQIVSLVTSNHCYAIGGVDWYFLNINSCLTEVSILTPGRDLQIQIVSSAMVSIEHVDSQKKIRSRPTKLTFFI